MAVPHLYFYLYILGDQTLKLVDITKIVISDDVVEGNNGTFDITTLKWNSIYEMANLISYHTGCEIIVGNKKGAD